MKKKPIISVSDARKLALNAQLIGSNRQSGSGKGQTFATIQNLGYIQIDTIPVIERAHHHTLWVRQSDYQPDFLHQLQAHDKEIFEYWGHAASYLPLTDYRYYIPLMKQFPGKNSWIKNWVEKYGQYQQKVLKRIEKEGPLSAQDFASPPGKKSGWWDWKPAKVALELLFWRGKLMIRERRNFHKIYDLTERVLPANINTTIPADDELGQFFVLRALKSLGLATKKEISDHIHAANKKVIGNALDELTRLGTIEMVSISKNMKKVYFVETKTLNELAKYADSDFQISILCPFDNLIIQRDRTKDIFGFEYTLECYLPAKKRKFGYFCLPILCGDSFLGRFDIKADRKAKKLIINSMHFEAGIAMPEELAIGLAAKLSDMACFTKCPKIIIKKSSNSDYKRLIRQKIKAFQ